MPVLFIRAALLAVVVVASDIIRMAGEGGKGREGEGAGGGANVGKGGDRC